MRIPHSWVMSCVADVHEVLEATHKSRRCHKGCDETPHRIHRTHRSLIIEPLPRPHPDWARLNCLTNTDPNLLPFTTYTESCPVTALFGLRCVRCIWCGVSLHRHVTPSVGGCHKTPHRPHRPQIQRYLTLNKQQEQQNASQKRMKTVTCSFS